MTNKKLKTTALILGLMLTAGNIAPVLAGQIVDDSENPTEKTITAKNQNTEARMANLKSKADQEINRRITSLNALNARIQAMKKISDANKTGIATTIQSQISALTTLQAKIKADTDLETLRADVQSITKSYRIYALVIPQGAITAAADRVLAIVETMNALETKLQTRISEAKTAGKDVASMETALADFKTKLSDAKSEAEAAVSEVSGLTPDEGDQAKMQANLAAMKSAKAKIKTAHEDIVAARKDAMEIIQTLKSFGNAGTKTKTQAQTQTSAGNSAE